jgi:hypothetical protein
MMTEESETPDAGSQPDTAADALAARRARHADPAVIRRAEAAEAVARNLETHLAALEQRIEEVGRERERVAQQLSERETDVRSVKQREYAEQQLRVEAEERSDRLQREMRAQIQELSTRLQETERHVRELSAELTQLRERDARLTPIVRELMDVAAGLRAGFERELTTLREELQQQVVWERETYVRELTAMGARMEDLRFELTRTAADLRAQLSAESLDATLLTHTTVPESEREAAHRREMADALVAAVERLRARVAEVKEAEQAEASLEAGPEPPVDEPAVVREPPAVDEAPVEEETPAAEPIAQEPPVEDEASVEEEAPAAETIAQEPPAEEPAVVEQSPVVEPPADERAGGLAAPIAPEERLAPPESPLPGLGPSSTVSTRAVTSEPIALQSRLLSVPEKRISWLAPAIRRLAAQRDAKLAAELVIELIPAQRELVDTPVNYEIKIAELGTFYVALDPDQATISREPRGSADFSLEGPVAAFSELAAGGVSRRHPGIRIRKGKRRARRFLKMRRRPIALADLAVAGVDVWPGLLLLAMAEAIDSAWTAGRRFELAFAIRETAGIVIYVRVCDGAPVLVSRTAAGQPVATVSLSGHALVCLLAGTEPPPEHPTLVSGDVTSVDMFLQWTARAQGLSVAGV